MISKTNNNDMNNKTIIKQQFDFQYQPSFTSQQLELIIDNYLGLYPYSMHLISLLPQNAYSYTFTEVYKAINSAKFYALIPLYISSLLTTTNIRIVVAVLKVVGEKGTQLINQRIRKIPLLRMVITLLTIYQRQNNSTSLPDKLQVVNQILKHADILITPNILSKYRPSVKIEQGYLHIDQLIPVVAHSLSIEGIRRKLMAQGDPKDKFRSVRVRQMGIAQLLSNVTRNSSQLINLPRNNTNLTKKETSNPNNMKNQPKYDFQFSSDEQDQKPKKIENFNKLILNGYLEKIQIQKEFAEGTAQFIEDIQKYEALCEKEKDQQSQTQNKFCKASIIMSLDGFGNPKRVNFRKQTKKLTNVQLISKIKATDNESTRAGTKVINNQKSKKDKENINTNTHGKLYQNYLQQYKENNKSKVKKALDFVRSIQLKKV